MAERKIYEIEIIPPEGIQFKRKKIELHVDSCRVSSVAQLIAHPIENGQQVIDNKVLNPRAIEIRAFVDADDETTKWALREMWRYRKYNFCTISTREAKYENFCCVECSHTENNQKLDMLEYSIRFQEIIANNWANTTDRGNPDDKNVTEYGREGS